MLPAAILYCHQKFFFTLGLRATELDQRFTLQWISGPDYWTRRQWCPRVLDERPAGVRLSHSHYLHLFLSTRCGKFFTVGCVRLPATFSRSYAQATTYREETTYRVGSYGMPAYQGSSRESYFNSVRFDSNFSRRGELFNWKLKRAFICKYWYVLKYTLIQHNFFHEIRTPTENKHARIVEIG